LETRDGFGLTLTRNDEAKHKMSVCDALAEALTVCGRKTTYAEIKKLYVHRDFARFRKENAIASDAWKRKESIKMVAAALAEPNRPKGPLSLGRDS